MPSCLILSYIPAYVESVKRRSAHTPESRGRIPIEARGGHTHLLIRITLDPMNRKRTKKMSGGNIPGAREPRHRTDEGVGPPA